MCQRNAYGHMVKSISNSLPITILNPKYVLHLTLAQKNSLQRGRHNEDAKCVRGEAQPKYTSRAPANGSRAVDRLLVLCSSCEKDSACGAVLACIWAPLVRSICSCPFVAERKGDQTRGDHALHALLRVRGSYQCIFFCVSYWKTTKIGM